MGSSQEHRETRRRAASAFALVLALVLPAFGQLQAQEVVSPEQIAGLARRLDQLDRAGKSAVLDLFVEAANRPSDRLTDSFPLHMALRNAGPQIAKIAED